MRQVLAVTVLGLAVPALALAQTTAKKEAPAAKPAGTAVPDHGLYRPEEVKWMDAPNALPAGAKLGVLEGDPFKEGLYTMRLRAPDAYKIPPHFHKKVEHVTVISGQFNLGMGEKFDDKAAQAMPAGTFGFLPPGMKHFAFAKGETVIQLHGMGPWEIVYVNPADDPRGVKK